MLESLKELLQENEKGLIKAAIVFLVIILTFLATRLFKRYLFAAGEKHRFAEQRTNSISKLGQTVIVLVSAAIISNVLGFRIQGIAVAMSSFFAIVGIAFFATWSILSNVTASVIIYFTFPFRIGDRLVVEQEPKYTGTLKDVTLLYLRIQTDRGSTITIPANVAIQKIITIQSSADRAAAEEEAMAEKNKA